jgi:hypothetical protein
MRIMNTLISIVVTVWSVLIVTAVGSILVVLLIHLIAGN